LLQIIIRQGERLIPCIRSAATNFDYKSLTCAAEGVFFAIWGLTTKFQCNIRDYPFVKLRMLLRSELLKVLAAALF
jgi:hypothetical protein